MRLPNPNQHKEFDEVRSDVNGNPEYGIRHDDDGTPEYVHIPTNRSNHAYFQPDVVMDPSGCSHDFRIINMGKREIECVHCRYETSFHAGRNYFEDGTGSFVEVLGGRYPVR